MRKRDLFIRFGVLVLWFSGKTIAQDARGLKDYYQDYFSIGVAVSPRALATDEAALIRQHFNSITAENAMKIGPVHPREDEYFWKDADSIVAFAQRHRIKMRGHTLVWHNQTPDWLFKDQQGNKASKDLLLSRLRSHIHTVVGRYRGKIQAWDVVNEAVSDRRGEYLRPSPWLEICGEEFIAKAFEFAHEADPGALLFYNDYNEIDPDKRAKIIRLVTSLRNAGVPIHGIGLQAHWALDEPTRDQLQKTLDDFSKTGLTLHITELDVSVYPKEHQSRERQPKDDDTAYTAAKEKKQEETYQMCFELFRAYKEFISSVTFWNVSDRHSWLDHFPVRNRKDYPLLFDRNLKPKTSYYKVINFEE
ncbi:MAG TPA: endo-1,4-beta-xylanase [Chryseosolibacter sp.]|nr:endo-1,4-beta-xylanase [Chryseosolibacter sp.]